MKTFINLTSSELLLSDVIVGAAAEFYSAINIRILVDILGEWMLT